MREQHARKVLTFATLLPDSHQQAPFYPLPVPLVPLLGREGELAELSSLLKRPEVRLVTITGTGGVGKTHLSLQVAAELRNSFVDGVCFVPLASTGNPDLVLPTIGATLGLHESGEQSPLERVAAFVQDQHLLLLLDNLEQVLPAAPALTALLSACPHLRVLVTSRALLQVEGEYVFLLKPLAVPDPTLLPGLKQLARVAAVKFFTQRAQAHQSAFRLCEENARAVAEICVRLDGLPQALELAAARTRLLPPAALLARLERRSLSLSSPRQDLPVRQQTMRNSIAWSYEILFEEEQKLFRRLAVCVGGFAPEVAEALDAAFCDSTTPTLDVLARLLDKSLLYREEREGEELRLLMLETVRAYGLEVLAACGEDEFARRTHSAYYLVLAEESGASLRCSDMAGWSQHLEHDQGNFREALRFFLARQKAEEAQRLTAALRRFWELSGHESENYWTLVRGLEADYTDSAVPAGRKGLCAIATASTASREEVHPMAQVLPGASKKEHPSADATQAQPPLPSPVAARPAGLTKREFEVLTLVVQGLSNALIAAQLVISPTTVHSYLRSIYSKLGVTSRLGAMRYAINHHLLSCDSL